MEEEGGFGERLIIISASVMGFEVSFEFVIETAERGAGRGRLMSSSPGLMYMYMYARRRHTPGCGVWASSIYFAHIFRQSGYICCGDICIYVNLSVCVYGDKRVGIYTRVECVFAVYGVCGWVLTQSLAVMTKSKCILLLKKKNFCILSN